MSGDLREELADRLRGPEDDKKSEGLLVFEGWLQEEIDVERRERLQSMMRSNLQGRLRGFGPGPESVLDWASTMIAEHQHAALTAVEGFDEWWGLWCEIVERFNDAHGRLANLDWFSPADQERFAHAKKKAQAGDEFAALYVEAIEEIQREHVPCPLQRALEGPKPVDPRTQKENQ